MSAAFSAIHLLRDNPPNTPELELHPLLLDVRVLLLDLVGKSEGNDGQSSLIKLYYVSNYVSNDHYEGLTERMLTGVFFVELGLPLEYRAGLVSDSVGNSSHGRHGPCWQGLMNVGQNGEVAGVLECSRDETGLGQVVLHDSAVPSEAEVEEVEHLS